MRRIHKLFLYLLTSCPVFLFAQQPIDNPKASKILLPNGWTLSPAGRSLQLGDLPLNMQLSPSKKLLAVTNNGQGKQSIQLIDPKTEKLLADQPIKTAWYGLKFSDDSKTLYVSGGNDNIILAYPILKKSFGEADTIRLGAKWPKEKISPTGIDVDKGKNLLYTVTKEDSSLYIVNLKSKTVVKKLDLAHEAYTCILSPNKQELYISLWGGDKIIIYDVENQTIVDAIATESHPNEMICAKDGKHLFVANANSNSVSIIDLQARKVIETISTALYPTQLTGSTPDGLALSEDEKTLYIANADNNCLAVFDVTEANNSKSLGFIPTGWYPTNVKVVGSKILVSNGKGFSSLPNPHGPQPIKVDDSDYQKGSTTKKEVQYIGSLFKGTLSLIDAPDENLLKHYSAQVYANTPFKNKLFNDTAKLASNPIPLSAKHKSPIKHVFYIIKENRTYDQVLGDVKNGNGDSSLCIFPERVTPNQHALVNDFVLLDNFYVDAEVSADGHNWSTAAYATDYVEKSWPISYGGRGGSYDFEGTRKIAYPKDGFIWDYCQRAGVSYRSYGEFSADNATPLKSLVGHLGMNYPGFDLTIKDVERFALWKKDFDSLLNKNAVPQFNTIRFSNDHTSGQKKGMISPIAAVADNDQAVGRFIDYLSHSAIWKESVVFILEDDAQNGPDHVDAHRSPVYVVGPYVKRNSVVHTMYSTSGVLRTIELILGLPPMSQYDAAAMPLYDAFTSTPNFMTFKSIAPQVDLNKRNVAINESSKRSEKWNFAKEDSAPDLDLNEVIWKSIKGENAIMPAPRKSAFVKLEIKKDDD